MNDLTCLNKKLSEWVGVDLTGVPEGCEPNFTKSLDLCFEQLVPKVIKSADYSVIIIQNLARCTAYIRPMQGGIQFEAHDNQNPALALCKAIEKLMDKGVSNELAT